MLTESDQARNLKPSFQPVVSLQAEAVAAAGKAEEETLSLSSPSPYQLLLLSAISRGRSRATRGNFQKATERMGREREVQQQQQQQVAFTVEQLVAVNPYNPDILPDLENYVNEQVASQTYSLDANLCLLRLYQFEPERMSTQIVVRILVKALMAMPAPDFSLCLFLIPERVQMEEQFKQLIVLSHYLETGRFRQFWDEAAKSRHIVEAVPGFEQAVHSYAIHLLSLTYQKVPRSVLAEAINIEGLSLDKFLEQQSATSGWVIERGQGRGQLIAIPKNEFNDPGMKKNAVETIPLEHITRIFPVLG